MWVSSPLVSGSNGKIEATGLIANVLLLKAQVVLPQFNSNHNRMYNL